MAVEIVYRGGARPGDADHAAEMIVQRGCLYAHEDSSVAALYGRVGRIRIDTSRYLDASTDEGLVAWQKINGAIDWLGALRAAGYAGAIYPDPHDWSDDGVETEGFEIAIVDPASIIWS